MMLQMLTLVTAGRVMVIHRDERGADAVEYLLTIAVVMIALVAAIAAGLPGNFVSSVISAVNGAVVGCANGSAC